MSLHIFCALCHLVHETREAHRHRMQALGPRVDRVDGAAHGVRDRGLWSLKYCPRQDHLKGIQAPVEPYQ